MKKKITSVLIIMLCVLMAVPWGVFAQAVNAEKSAENTQQQTTAPAPTPTPETTVPAAEPTPEEPTVTPSPEPTTTAPEPTPNQPAETPQESQDESVSTLADYPDGRAVLDTGDNVNYAIKQLTGQDMKRYRGNETIQAILRSNSPAPAGVTTKNLSISRVPVIAWWDAQAKTIYWYSKDSKPMLNADSVRIFSYFTQLTRLDLSHFDTSKVTDMGAMFAYCGKLTSLDVTRFNTSNVTSMESMFANCHATSLDLSHFDTSKVTDIRNMFWGCSGLTRLDLSRFNTSKVTNMSYMFYCCTSLTRLDISNFDTSKVTNMSFMFLHCRSLKTIYASEKFKTLNVTESDNMFNDCIALIGGNGTGYDANHTDIEYARIDKPGQPGYFTEKEAFEWGVDNFNFTNERLNFYTLGELFTPNVKTYRTLINSKYVHALGDKLTAKEFAYILSGYNPTGEPLWADKEGNEHYEPRIDQNWFGACNGMSSLVLLGKAGMVPYSEYGGSSIHSLSKPVDNDELSSLITYYQLLQFKDWNWRLSSRTLKQTHATNIQNILKGLKKKGTVLVGYQSSHGGHVVIAYGEGDGRTINGRMYDKCIKICDPNDTSENSDNFLYYDSKTYDWIIPKNEKIISAEGAKINTVLSNPADVNHDGYLSTNIRTYSDDTTDDDISLLEDAPYIARLEIYQGNVSGIKKVTKDANGNYVEKAEQGDGSDIVKETFYSGDQDDKGIPGYTLSDAESAYKVTQNTAGPMELILDYENTLYHVRAEKAKSVIFDKNGFVSVDADKGNCAVEMTNNNDNPTDWFTNYAKTTDATKLSMTKTNQGYEVASDNLKDTKVMAANKEETKEEKVSTQKDKMIICETKKDLDVKVDNTGDGKYETSIVDEAKPSDEQAIAYRTHVQNVGWQPYMTNGTIAGTSGFGYRLEAMNINLQNQKYTGDIEYRTHIENIGWENEWKKNDAMSGTSGLGYRLEAMQIRLTGGMAEKYDVYYRVHAQNIGWLGWAKNGEESGTAGYGYRLEAMQIMLVDKGGAAPTIAPTSATDKPFVEKFKNNVKTDSLVAYQNHVQNVGWQNYAVDGGVAGTSGLGYRLEGMKIFLNNPKYKGDIEYRTHIENIGWENEWKKNDAMSGTSGLGYRLEAMQIRLTGEMANHYDVYYRVHAQNIGWLGWAKNGEESGTAGYGYRLEAMQIVLVDKGGKAPNISPASNDNRAFIDKNAQPVQPVEPDKPTSDRAVLDTGKNVNTSIKQLSGDGSNYNDDNKTIKAVVRSNSPAPSGVTTKNLSTTSVPITAWWVASSQTIYWYSKDPKPMLNADSSYMFADLYVVENIDAAHFDTSNVTNMSNMFVSCESLTDLNVKNLDTSKVTDMHDMFFGCKGLTSLDLKNFNTSNVTSMFAMFSGCESLTNLNVTHFNTSKVTDMNYMFSECKSLANLDVTHFDTSNVTEFQAMFRNCDSLTSLDVTHFDTSKVATMESMFESCDRLTNLDVTHFDTSNVTTMRMMFCLCKSLVDLDVTHFNTSNVTNMLDMFIGCSNLTNLDVTHFDTSNVTNMNGMFANCDSLTSLDVTSFNTSNVTSMSSMFASCKNLKTIYASNEFTIGNDQSSSRMFIYSSALVGGKGTAYDANHTDGEYARIDKEGQPGYFTQK